MIIKFGPKFVHIGTGMEGVMLLKIKNFVLAPFCLILINLYTRPFSVFGLFVRKKCSKSTH